MKATDTAPRAIRRYAHLTRDDVEALRMMPEAMGRAYEKLIQRQWEADRREREHQADSDIDGYAVARRVHGEGAGGGRRRGRPPGGARDV